MLILRHPVQQPKTHPVQAPPAGVSPRVRQRLPLHLVAAQLLTLSAPPRLDRHRHHRAHRADHPVRPSHHRLRGTRIRGHQLTLPQTQQEHGQVSNISRPHLVDRDPLHPPSALEHLS